MSHIRVALIILAVSASSVLLGAETPSVASANLAHLATAPVPSPGAAVAQPAGVTPQLIAQVRELDARRTPLQDFRARLAVVLKKGEKEYTLSGMYSGNAQGDFRLSLNWGIISLLDAAFKGEQVELWLPRKGKLCRGPRSEVRTVESDLRVLERIGSVSELFFPDAWAQDAVARRLVVEDGRPILNVLERREGEILPARRVLLGTFENHCVVERVVLFDKGEPVGAVAYRDYYEISGWLVPRTVEIWASATTRIVLQVEGLAINTQRPLELSIQAPSGQKEADLAETLKAGKLLE
jgi:hypothetical protein